MHDGPKVAQGDPGPQGLPGLTCEHLLVGLVNDSTGGLTQLFSTDPVILSTIDPGMYSVDFPGTDTTVCQVMGVALERQFDSDVSAALQPDGSVLVDAFNATGGVLFDSSFGVTVICPCAPAPK